MKDVIMRGRGTRIDRTWGLLALLCWFRLIQPVVAGDIELLSARETDASTVLGGNGDSLNPVVSPDGRFVLFSSSANNLVTNDDGHFGLDLFLHDRDSGLTTLISVNTNGTGGGDGHSLPGMVSTNGRFVVFESTSRNLAPLKTSSNTDVFLRDMETGATRLLSRRPDGVAGNRSSRGSVITPDGAWVAFSSVASDLWASDTNLAADVFLYNVASNTLEVVGVAEALFPTNVTFSARIGGSEPSFSADGRKLLFVSNANNLLAGVPPSLGELYVLDLDSRQVTWASQGAADLAFSDPNRLNAISSRGVLNADGRWLTFRTAVVGSQTNVWIFHRDLQASAPVVVTPHSLQPRSRQDEFFDPGLSADGRFVAYVEAAETPDSGSVVRRWDAQTASSVLVSGDEAGKVIAGTWSTSPAISADGRVVSHLSTATNLSPAIQSSGLSLYRHDLVAGDVQVTRVGPVDEYRPEFGMSADGEWLVVHSQEPLSGEPTAAHENVFVRSLDDPSPRLLSRHHEALTNTPADPVGFLVGQLSVSADGRWVALASYAGLASKDDNDQMDVFVFDRARGRTLLVSAGLDGFAAKGGASFSPAISGNGRYVAFLSMATNLVAAAPSANVRLFRHDLLTGSTELVSVSTNGTTPFQRDVSDPLISYDGRRLAYASRGATGPLETHWRDMESDVAVTLGGNTQLQPPSMGTNGLEVAYLNGTGIRVWNALGLTNRNVSAPAGRPVISPNGGHLLVYTASSISSASLSGTGFQSISGVSPWALQGQQIWSGDGSHFLVVVRAPMGSDSNNTNDVFLCAATNSANRVLLSRKLVSNSTGNGPSDSPAFSADGRFVVFRTWATDIVPVSGPGPHLVLHDREIGTNRLVTPDRPGGSSLGLLIQPRLSGAGETLLFAGWRPDLETGRGLGVLAVAFSPLDFDRDGLLDDWERLHFEGLSKNGALDSDLDGMTDREEYLAGTDPNDKTSVLRLVSEATLDGNGDERTFRWPSGVDAVSRLQFTEDLSHPLWRNMPGGRRWADGWLEQNRIDPGVPINLFFRVIVDE